MSDPQGRLSGLHMEEAPLNRSSSAADFLPDTSQYFEAWLENVKPSLEPKKNHTEPVHLTAAGEPAPSECLFEGRFEGRFEGTLRTDGYVTGFLHSLTGTLIIGESGEVEADVIVATAIIDGVLRGNIHATERVVLDCHARVFGNIESAALSIQRGAVFEGQSHFLPSRFKADSEGNGRTSFGAPTFSRPLSADSLPATEEAGEEEAEPLAVAAGR